MSVLVNEYRYFSKVRRYLVAFSALCLFGSSVLADSSAGAVHNEQQNTSFAEVKLNALIQSEQVKKIHAGLSEQLAESLAVKQFQNPQLQGSVGMPAVYSGQRPSEQLQLTLSQSLRVSDWGTRASVSDLIAAVASSDQQLQLRQFIAELALTYTSAWLLQIEQQHLAEQLQWTEKLLGLILSSSASGRFTQTQKHLVQATVEKNKAQLLGLKHAQVVARARLARLAGSPLMNVQLQPIKLDRLPNVTVLWNKLEDSELSLLGRQQARERLSKARLSMEKQDRFADFQPQLGYARNEDGDHFVGLGFSVALPIFDRNQANIARASAQVSATGATLNYLRSSAFKEEFTLLVAGAQAKLEQAQAYEDRVIPSLKQLVDSSQTLFNSGQLNLLELWQSKIEYHSALDEASALWGEALAMQLEVSALCGWSVL